MAPKVRKAGLKAGAAGRARPAAARVYGVDFSGAADAGKKMLVAECDLRAAAGRSRGWRLRVRSLRAARELPGGGPGPASATGALCAELLRARAAAPELIVGVDSPPSVAARFVRPAGWKAWAARFARTFPTPEAFRAATREAGGGGGNREPKRVADVRQRTPFAPQNLRMYKQTWWAITGVYAPLAAEGFSVVPCTPPRERAPMVFESCPASVLKRLGLYSPPYKGPRPEHRRQRSAILRRLRGGVPVGGRADAALRVDVGAGRSGELMARRLLADAGGDALDAVLAAVGAACSTRRADFPAPEDGEFLEIYRVEACVYS